MQYYRRTNRGYGSENFIPIFADDIGHDLKKARRKFEAARRTHRTIRRAFTFGCSLILAQFPFSFLGSDELHASTSILGGVMTFITGAMLVYHYGTGEGLPDLDAAREAYEETNEAYTRALLGGDDVG